MANIKRISKLDYVVIVMDISNQFWDPSRYFKDEIRERLSVVCECPDEDNCTCHDRLVYYKNQHYTTDTSISKQIIDAIGQNHNDYIIMKCSSVLEAMALAKIFTEDPHEYFEMTDLSMFEIIEIGNIKTLLMSFVHD